MLVSFSGVQPLLIVSLLGAPEESSTSNPKLIFPRSGSFGDSATISFETTVTASWKSIWYAVLRGFGVASTGARQSGSFFVSAAKKRVIRAQGVKTWQERIGFARGRVSNTALSPGLRRMLVYSSVRHP